MVNVDGSRILIHGMQSSGASLFALLVGQIPRSLVVVDLWNPEIAPALDQPGSTAVKTTAGVIPVELHRRAFRPTLTILYLRHPVDVAVSLSTKSYRDYGGSLGEKLSGFDRTFESRSAFDFVLYHERLITEDQAVLSKLRKVGVPVPMDAYAFPRSASEIVRHACAVSPWCRANYRTRWGLGNLHLGSLDQLAQLAPPRTDEAWRLAQRHSPCLLEHYVGTSL